MQTYDVTGHEVIEGQHEARDARDAVLQFLLKNPEADVDYVGSRGVIGLCESTGTPILDGDDYTEDGDGIKILVTAIDGKGEDDSVFTDEVDPEDPDAVPAPDSSNPTD